MRVVGIGPGSPSHLSHRAAEALRCADAVVGYRTYIELVEGLLAGKQVLSSGMGQEIERCRRAVELAAKGLQVAVISGGDPGVYGMSGPALEVAAGTGIEVEVIPGITAASAAAAALGAPLMNDFAVISLSDLLVPWEAIEKRISLAAKADFVIVFYNPSSSRRKRGLELARSILLEARSGRTPVGLVRNWSRTGESLVITDLASMLSYTVDMLTTVIVGNSFTRVVDGRMVTPRGYSL